MNRAKTIASIFAQAKRLGLSKAEINETVLHITSRTESIRACTLEELYCVSSFLYQQVDDSKDRMRKKVIALLRECGYQVWSHKSNRMEADMQRIYQFVQKHGVASPKLFNHYNAAELAKLVTQVEIIHSKNKQKA